MATRRPARASSSRSVDWGKAPIHPIDRTPTARLSTVRFFYRSAKLAERPDRHALVGHLASILECRSSQRVVFAPSHRSVNSGSGCPIDPITRVGEGPSEHSATVFRSLSNWIRAMRSSSEFRLPLVHGWMSLRMVEWQSYRRVDRFNRRARYAQNGSAAPVRVVTWTIRTGGMRFAQALEFRDDPPWLPNRS